MSGDFTKLSAEMVVLRAELRAVRAISARSVPLYQPRDGRDALVDWDTIDQRVGEISERKFALLRIPRDGEEGKPGRRGDVGPQGVQGKQGVPGQMGPMPEHKWDGTKLSFENPDGSFDKPVDLQGPPGTAGANGGIVGPSFIPSFFSYQPAGFL